jgi:hypothetical protein
MYEIIQAEVLREVFKKKLEEKLNDGKELVSLDFFTVFDNQQCGFAILKDPATMPCPHIDTRIF